MLINYYWGEAGGRSFREKMRSLVSLFLLLLLAVLEWGALAESDIEEVRVRVIVNATVATTDDHFVCATLDWGPPEKCGPNEPFCNVPQTSVLNLDLNNPLLAKAVKAFDRLRIRIGGSLQDQVMYDVGELQSPCSPFQKDDKGLFGYTKGCLHMDRWDELNGFFRQTGDKGEPISNRVIVTFGLNALYGRTKGSNGVWTGDWDLSNTRSLIEYTAAKGFEVDSWELGNELSGRGIGASVSAQKYAEDLIKIKSLLRIVHNGSSSLPLLLAPGGFYEQQWYEQLLQNSGPGVVDVLTHHIYNLGATDDPNLMKKVLDPVYLANVVNTFKNLQNTMQKFGQWASVWVGEAGGVFRGGAPNFSDTFVNSFWYLDQLGVSSMYDTKVYCRQTLIGSNYSLLNIKTMIPNPDYYSALLWHRLMGKRVLFTNTMGSKYLKAYTHCSKDKDGITMLLINLSTNTTFTIVTETDIDDNTAHSNINSSRRVDFIHGLKKMVSWVGKIASHPRPKRCEFHLTPKDGNLRSQTMLLNGQPLELTPSGDIPPLNPVFVDANSTLSVMPLSIAFVTFPDISAPACCALEKEG